MRLFTLEVVKHLHDLLRNGVFYALESEKLFEWSGVQQFRFLSLGLPRVFATYGVEADHPLQTERPAMSRAEVVDLNIEKIILRVETSSGVELCRKKSPYFVYGEGKPPIPKYKEVDSKKRKSSSSITMIGKKVEKCDEN